MLLLKSNSCSKFEGFRLRHSRVRWEGAEAVEKMCSQCVPKNSQMFLVVSGAHL